MELKQPMSYEEQLNRLVNGNNFIPASTAFVNIDKVREINLRHDIRIPNLEDLPKWVNALRLKVKFHFMDTQTVKYRHSSSHNHQLNYLFLLLVGLSVLPFL